MPTYRVEVSPNNRAGCQDGVCKKEGDKIKKGEIRFGTWVEGSTGDGREFQSWKWRHWGCVSGKTMQNIRESLNRDGGEGQYAWDYMDGLEDMPVDLQNKVKTAITEGKIADEDWKGDPEYNVLGKTGIRGRVSTKKKDAEHEEGQEGSGDLETPTKPPTKKRGRTKKDGDSEEEGSPAKKKRATKAKKEDESEGETKPVKKPRARKAAEAEVSDAAKSTREVRDEIEIQNKLEKKPRAKKAVKKEEDRKPAKAEAEAEIKPEKKSKAKKVVTKKDEDAGTAVKVEGNDETNVEVKPVTKARARKVIKKESVEDEEKADVKPAKKASAKKVVKTEDVDDFIRSQKPDDPLEQISQGFCDENGPLMKEFNEMIDAGKVDDDDWGQFLSNKFGSMVTAGQLAQDDFSKFLQQMYDREVATMQPQVTPPKKDVKSKKPAGTTAVRGRKSKAT